MAVSLALQARHLVLLASLTMATTTPFQYTASLTPVTSNFTVVPNELLATLALRGVKVSDLLSRFGNIDATALLQTALNTGLRSSRIHPHLEGAELTIVALDLDQVDGVDITLTLQPVNTSELSCAMRDYIDNGHAQADLQQVVSLLSQDTITALNLLELRSCATCKLPSDCSVFGTDNTTTAPAVTEPLLGEEEQRKPSKVMIIIVASVGTLILIVIVVTAVQQCQQKAGPTTETDAAPSFSNPVCKLGSCLWSLVYGCACLVHHTNTPLPGLCLIPCGWHRSPFFY
jgi:hypothetical protein